MFILDINDNFPMTSSIQLMTLIDDKTESKSLSKMSENVTGEDGKVNTINPASYKPVEQRN